MLKFFRKVSQRLLTESSFSRHFLYALGEIVLVVIGILIALQVNNWNEHRKISRTNEVLKHKLIGEPELNMERLGSLDSVISSNAKLRGIKQLKLNTDTALHFLQHGLDSEKALLIMENPMFFYGSFNLHSSVFEEMKSTGRLYAPGSDSLIHAIDKYYRRLEREEYYYNSRNERCIARLFECKFGWQMLEMDYELSGESAIGDHVWLFDSRSGHFLDFKMALYTSNTTYRQAHRRIKEILDDSEALIAFIRREMKSKDL